MYNVHMATFPDEAARLDWDWSQGPPPDPVIEAYKMDVDRTLLRENLKLTVEQRVQKLISMQEFFAETQKATGF